jgi:hypothetical protein
VDVGDDDVDIDLVLALVYLDIHLVYNLTYGDINSIWSFVSIGNEPRPYVASIEIFSYKIFFLFKFKSFQISDHLMQSLLV